jgi:ankyrin repeat protein
MSPTSADLMDSVRRGDVDAVAEALRAQPSLAGSRDENGVSAFMWASYVRQPAVRDLLRAALPSLDIFETIAAGDDERALELLSKLPALANAWSGDGFTALHFAGFFSRPAIAERLIMMSADVNAVARNPMRVAPIHSAVTSRCLDVVRLLLARGASPDAQQESGFTALMAAGMLGDDALADLLLARGARLDLKHDDGRTAADMAAEKGHTALAARLRGPGPA